MNPLIAYDTNDLDAVLIKEKAENWQKKGLISVDKLNDIKAHYLTAFYSPNVFIRIGAFLFCTLLIYAIFGLFILAGLSSTSALSFNALFVGIMCLAGLELVIHSNHYRSGIDDALLYCGLGFIIGGLMNLMTLDFKTLPFYLTFLPLLLIAAIRYADSLIAAIVYGFLMAIIALTLQKIWTGDPSVYSVIFAVFAAFMYFLAQKFQANDAFRFWKNNLDVVETLSLIVFYASCNYYVLQQINEVYFENPTVALAPLFWFLTFFVPIFYIYQGLKQRNRLLLSVGLLAIAAGVMTFRYYFHVVPMEVAAIVGGAVLLAFAYFSIQYLKRNKTPFTYEEDGSKPFYQQAESLIIAQSLGGTTEQEGGKPQFGGGDFGGGGAGSDF
jgi:uncharacterized membrane protein YgcG